MARFAAFLRGVMPTNVKMPALKQSFEAAGFENVRTVLGSGNVVFDTRAASLETLQRKAEAAMTAKLGRVFKPFIRDVETLRKMLEDDPFRGHRFPADAKRVVTFLSHKMRSPLKLPIAIEGAHILEMDGLEVFTAYLPNPKGPVWMALLEKTFGKDVTTRTWETVRKVAR